MPTGFKRYRVGALAFKARKVTRTHQWRFEERLARARELPADAAELPPDGFMRIPWREIKSAPARFRALLERHGSLEVRDRRGRVFIINAH
jgi:hypothetical protein